MRNVFVAIIVMALAGCTAVPPRDTADIIELPLAFASGAVTAPALEVCVALSPPAAQAWLQRATAGNFDLARAAARLRQAEALARAAASPLLPRLDGQLDATRTDSPQQTFGIPQSGVNTNYQGSIAASYEIDVWSSLRNEKAAAALDAQTAARSLASIELTLRAQTLDTWFSAVAQQQLVTLLNAQTNTSEKFLELTRLRFGLGQVPAQDIVRQKQQVLNLQGQQILAQANAGLLLSRLQTLSGVAPGIYKLAAEPLPATPALADPGLPADVVARRPDVQAAWTSLAAADRRTAVAIADRLPSLRLSASLLSLENSLGDVFADAFWSLGATITGNIFDRGGQRALIDLADARAEEALADYADVLLTSLAEVHDALLRNVSQDKFNDSLRAQYDEAQKVLALTRDSYRGGQASYLDVLNALLSVQGLERERIDAQRQQFSNRIDLRRAAGIAPGPGSTS